MIRDAQEGDFKAIVDIYNHYIRQTVVTFEEDDVAPAEMAARVHKVAHFREVGYKFGQWVDVG